MATNANCRQNETTPRNYAQQKKRNILNSYIALRQRSPQTRRLEAVKDLPEDNFFGALATYPRRAPTAPPNMMPPPSLYSSKPAPPRCGATLGREHFWGPENLPAPSNFQISSYPLNSSYPLKKASLFADFSKSTIQVSIHLRGKILRGKTGFRNLDPWAVFPAVGLEPSYPLKKV